MKQILYVFLGVALLFGVWAANQKYDLAEDQTVTRANTELFTAMDTFSTVALGSYVEWSEDMLLTGTANICLQLKPTDTISVAVYHGMWTSTLTKRWHKGEILYTASPTATYIDTCVAIPVRGRGLRVYVTGDDGSAGVTTGVISMTVKPTKD